MISVAALELEAKARSAGVTTLSLYSNAAALLLKMR